MSTGTPETPPATGTPEPPRMPTPADAQAIFDRAEAAARRAEDAASRLTAVNTAVQQESQTRFPDMPQEVIDKIAQGVVGVLGQQYELAAANPPPPASPASSESAPSSGGGSGGTATPSEQSSTGSDASTPPSADKPRNLAHRILGY